MHVNEVKLPGTDRWTEAFNYCSDMFQQAHDMNKTEQERDKAWDLWYEARLCLEQGIY